MALTETTTLIKTDTPNLGDAIPAFIEALRLRGFDVQHNCLADKVWELQLTKGSQLMQLAGLQSLVLYFVCTPALLLPAWGLLKQYHLDTEVLELLTRCLNHTPMRQV